MNFLLKIILGLYVLHEIIVIITGLVGISWVKKQTRDYIFNAMMNVQNGYYKIIKCVLKYIFKISIVVYIIMAL